MGNQSIGADASHTPPLYGWETAKNACAAALRFAPGSTNLHLGLAEDARA